MVNLFVNYFDHPDKLRRAEIEYCLEQNQINDHINKIIIVNRGERATYGDFFRAMMGYRNDINIIANSDIYFDDTIKLAEGIKERQCYALTRWEHIGGNIMDFNQRHGKPSPPQWSQDAWIFKGSLKADYFDSVLARSKVGKEEYIPFGLGIPGCDNKFAAVLRGIGINVTNPSKSIRAIHKHETSERSYPQFQILKGIRPHGLVYQTEL